MWFQGERHVTSEVALAVGVAIAGWWFFTGVILWLVHSPDRFGRLAFAGWTLLLPALFGATAHTAAHSSSTASVMGFTLSLLLWGWLELGYLLGLVTGPNRSECPNDASVGQRFRLGVGTCLYHELALIAFGVGLAVLHWQQPNPVAFWTFFALWAMRWSAKINLVLGVRNYNQSWLPEHLSYLRSYIPQREMNHLFPMSMAFGLGATLIIGAAAAGETDLPLKISLILTATITALGTLEHVFLMAPFQEGRLWTWAAPRRGTSLTDPPGGGV